MTTPEPQEPSINKPTVTTRITEIQDDEDVADASAHMADHVVDKKPVTRQEKFVKKVNKKLKTPFIFTQYAEDKVQVSFNDPKMIKQQG